MHPRVRPDRGGALAPDRGGREGGIVVQAVLVTVMVMAIGLLAVISRVASSRDGAAASSLAAAARQAAEFGFSEIVAEMNRDSKSYLWVVCKQNWSSISEDELKAKGIYTAGAAIGNPISLSANLPGSTELSYEVKSYTPPLSPADAVDPAKEKSFCETNTFGHLKGGTGKLEIIGTVKRASGDVTTYTLRRRISVGFALPEFRNPLTSPAGVSDSAVNPRFSRFPTPERLGATSLPEPWLDAKPLPSTFPKDEYGEPLPYCDPNPTGSAWVCRVNDLVVSSDVFADTSAKPIVIFVAGSFSIDSGKKFCASDASQLACLSGNLEMLKLRVFGVAAASKVCSQEVNIGDNSSRVKGFFWFPSGKLLSSSVAPVDGLAGSFCATPATAPSSFTPIPTQDLLDGLRDLRLLQYRGFGSTELAQ